MPSFFQSGSAASGGEMAQRYHTAVHEVQSYEVQDRDAAETSVGQRLAHWGVE